MTKAIESLPSRLTTLRESRNLTRYALALRAGLVPIHYTRIELGECDPKATTLRRIAEALGVEPGELL